MTISDNILSECNEIKQVDLLNFMVTQEGLEDQMLGITVAREETELEARREQLVLEDAENKRVQKDVEDTILELLKNSEGNILDDEVSSRAGQVSLAYETRLIFRIAVDFSSLQTIGVHFDMASTIKSLGTKSCRF